MRLSRTALHVYPRNTHAWDRAGLRAAVSLHSHSECSREKLDFVPAFARGIPLIAPLFERSLAEYEREEGRPLDFSAVYWRPPLPPAGVIASEREQIERRLDVEAFVSLTDHDTLEGPRLLRGSGRSEVPLSFEWSVPCDGSVFHLGVHNLSPKHLAQIEPALAAYTAGTTHQLDELLDALSECRETFVVLNHPFWDLGRASQLRHDSTLLTLLRRHRDRIHALELNGYRTWSENRRVLPLAEGFDLPVVGGGDRHGYAPNAIVNLTNACSLDEFAHELRFERVAHCVLFPEFTAPIVSRVLETADELLRPDHPHGRCRWGERVFVAADGSETPVDALWDRAPRWLTGAVAITRLLASPPFRPLFELTRSDGHDTLAADCHPDVPVQRAPPLATRSAAAA